MLNSRNNCTALNRRDITALCAKVVVNRPLPQDNGLQVSRLVGCSLQLAQTLLTFMQHTYVTPHRSIKAKARSTR